MRILGLLGSLRRESHNAALLAAAGELLLPGDELVAFGHLKAIPPFDEDDEGSPGWAVEALRDAVRGADAVLVVTPEYNGSTPGQLKNALDWLSRPFATNALRQKPAAVVGASTGMFGGVWAQAEARRVLGLIGARVLDEELAVPRVRDRLAGEGILADGEVRAGLERILAGLREHAVELPRAA